MKLTHSQSPVQPPRSMISSQSPVEGGCWDWDVVDVLIPVVVDVVIPVVKVVVVVDVVIPVVVVVVV